MKTELQKKFKHFETYKELTPEARAMLNNRRDQLTKQYEADLKFLNRLLDKPTMKSGMKVPNK